MYLHQINKNEIKVDYLDTERTLSSKVITKFIRCINVYCIETGNYGNVKLFINVYFLDDLINQIFLLPGFRLSKNDNIVGQLAGANVYISDLLDEHQIFIGESEKELQILKRKNKINKILQR